MSDNARSADTPLPCISCIITGMVHEAVVATDSDIDLVMEFDSGELLDRVTEALSMKRVISERNARLLENVPVPGVG